MPLSKRVRRIIQISILSLLLICATCLVWGFFIEPNRLVVNHYTVEIENWPREVSGLRIALIGDIHTDNRFIDEAKLRRIVELTNAAREKNDDDEHESATEQQEVFTQARRRQFAG